MKKIFGILSLIAMLMVALPLSASASDFDDGVKTEFVTSMISPDIVAVAVADAPTFGLFHVADFSVSYTANGEVVDSANIVSGVFLNNTIAPNYAKTFLPIEVGWSTVNPTSDATSNSKSATSYTNGYEVPEIVGRISANVGKLTDFSRSI